MNHSGCTDQPNTCYNACLYEWLNLSFKNARRAAIVGKVVLRATRFASQTPTNQPTIVATMGPLNKVCEMFCRETASEAHLASGNPYRQETSLQTQYSIWHTYKYFFYLNCTIRHQDPPIRQHGSTCHFFPSISQNTYLYRIRPITMLGDPHPPHRLGRSPPPSPPDWHPASPATILAPHSHQNLPLTHSMPSCPWEGSTLALTLGVVLGISHQHSLILHNSQLVPSILLVDGAKHP